jgi:hypothetical protein
MRRILASIVLVMMMTGCDSENASDTETPSEAEKSSEVQTSSEAPMSPEARAAQAAEMFQAGVAAFDRGDYPTALTLWLPLARGGLAAAQVNLGNAYLNGTGVFADDVEAAKWFRLAAEQGDPKAQNNLGVMYANGKGVPQSFTQAYVWFSIGASKAGNTTDAAKNRDLAAAQMSPEQIAEGQKLVQAWKPK